MAGKRMKPIYYFINVNGEIIGNYFKDRKSALAWEKENKNNFEFQIFLMKREILAKRYKEIFQEV